MNIGEPTHIIEVIPETLPIPSKLEPLPSITTTQEPASPELIPA